MAKTSEHVMWDIKVSKSIVGLVVTQVRRPGRRWVPASQAPAYVREFLALNSRNKMEETPDFERLERCDEVQALDKRPVGLIHRYRVRVWRALQYRTPYTRLLLSGLDECGHDNFYEFGRCMYKYTACGPWVAAVLLDGTEVYYDSPEGRALPMSSYVRCVKVGSIVEGSDVEIGPYEVTRKRDFWRTVEAVNEEAGFYWRRDNLALFQVEAEPGIDECIEWEWGVYDFAVLPKGVRETFASWLKEHGADSEEGQVHEIDGVRITHLDRSWETWG